ncbi:MAG: metal ABC transporter permease, partial [Bacteroidia bacterium]|nr:metal ABC transporter permease [Bacteroidia bacterium]
MASDYTAFFLLQDPNVRLVLAGTILIGIIAAITGCFTFLRKRALAGDAISHSVLPGVCLAFLFYGEKNPLVLMSGAIASGLLSLV